LAGLYRDHHPILTGDGTGKGTRKHGVCVDESVRKVKKRQDCKVIVNNGISGRLYNKK
jgi:hypothetical protein